MTRISDDKHLCDSCGFDCGNGGVAQCAVVSRMDKNNPGMVANYHFCEDRKEEVDGEEKDVKGCASKLLRPSMMKYHDEAKGAQ